MIGTMSTLFAFCVTAMSSSGKVLVIQVIVPSLGQSHISKLADLEMLALPGGGERTIDEYQELFEQAGLKLARVVPTEGFVSIFEGVPAS